MTGKQDLSEDDVILLFVDKAENIRRLIAKSWLALHACVALLATERGEILPLSATLQELGVTSNSELTAIVRQTQVFGKFSAFASLKGGRSLGTWGQPGRGGDCSAVQAQLQGDVQ